MVEPILIVDCEDGERLLEKLIGRQVLGLAYVIGTDAAMIQFDADTAVYFRIKDNRLAVEIEGPEIQ